MSPSPPSIASINLRRLGLVRGIALAVLAASALWAHEGLGLAFPPVPVAVILGGMMALTAITAWRMRRDPAVTDRGLFAHLVIDVLALTALLYFTGGSTNPFAPLYLLPLVFAAAALPGAFAWGMSALTIACYSTLIFFYIPLGHGEHDAGTAFHLHVLGMWLAFVLSAGLVAHFAARMASTLRERDRLRAEMRERELRHERILALGTLAAGAAHELGTPLATMAVLVGEMERETQPASRGLQVLREQIQRCKGILGRLSAAAGQTRAEGGTSVPVDDWLNELIAHWRVAHPDTRLEYDASGAVQAPRIVIDETLTQAIDNLLDNAADASPERIEMTARWTERSMDIEIRDEGPGLGEDIREHIGEPFVTTKEDGMGLGVFLARGTLERLGGRLELGGRVPRGTLAHVHLPLDALRIAS